MPVIPVFGSREPAAPDPRRRLHIVIAMLVASVLVLALFVALHAWQRREADRCADRGGEWNERARFCYGETTQ